MGRYYTGDIEGKFMFGVQASDDADFFGVTGYQPNYLEYFYETEDMPELKKGIAKCKKELGEWQEIIDNLFKKYDGISDSDIKAEGLDLETFNQKLQWYARLDLGEQIYKSIKDNGQCSFSAEL